MRFNLYTDTDYSRGRLSNVKFSEHDGAYTFWLSFDLTKTKLSKRHLFLSNSISSPPENCPWSQFDPNFCQFLHMLQTWANNLVLSNCFIHFTILFGVLRKIFSPKCLNFEIDNGGYLPKKSKKTTKNYQIFCEFG